MMSRKTKLAKNTFILGLGRIATKLVTFILLPIYTVYFTPSEYGLLDLVLTYVVYFVPFVTLQLEWAAFRYLIDARSSENEKSKIITNVLALVVPITVACVIVLSLLNIFINVPYFGAILIMVVATIFASIFLQFARGLGKNKEFMIASIFNGGVTLISSLLLVIVADWGVNGALISVALANAACVIYLTASLGLSKYFNLDELSSGLQKQLVKYTLPLVPEGLSWWVINVSDRTIVTTVLGVAANGIYAVSNKYAAIFYVLSGVVNMAWSESATVHIDDTDRDRYFTEVHGAFLRLFGSLGLVMIVALPFFFDLLIGPQFSEAYQYVPILIIGILLHAIAGTYSAIYIAKKLSKQVARTTMMAAIVNIVINIIFISSIGIYAAALSSAIAYLVLAVYRHYDVKKYVQITYDRRLLSIIGGMYVTTVALYYVNEVPTNIISALLVIVVSVVLNKSVVYVAKNKILSGRRRD